MGPRAFSRRTLSSLIHLHPPRHRPAVFVHRSHATLFARSGDSGIALLALLRAPVVMVMRVNACQIAGPHFAARPCNVTKRRVKLACVPFGLVFAGDDGLGAGAVMFVIAGAALRRTERRDNHGRGNHRKTRQFQHGDLQASTDSDACSVASAKAVRTRKPIDL